jgi:hypothetical protein
MHLSAGDEPCYPFNMNKFRFSNKNGLFFYRYLILILGVLLPYTGTAFSEEGLEILNSISLNYVKSEYVNDGEKLTHEIYNIGKRDVLNVKVIYSYGRNGEDILEKLIVNKVIHPKEKHIFSFFIPNINQIHPSGVIVGIGTAEFAPSVPAR